MSYADMALCAARYDTAMSRAMLACLMRMGVGVVVPVRTRAYEGVAWCLRNEDVPTPYKRKAGV